jgi:hypothetical protein
MKSPLLIALSLGALGLLAAAVPVLWHMLDPGAAPAPAAQDAPWQVQTPAPGQSRVFGLDLPGATLAQARQRWGEDLRVAIIVGPGGDASLEGYVERFTAAGVAGRLVLAFDGSPAELERWREGVPREAVGTGAWRHPLAPEAAARAAAAPLVGMTLIPAAQLDAAALTARFGEPAERRADGERLQHWLYPAIGLAVALDAEGKDVLQYVAPGEFEARLVAPLRAR